MINDKKKKDIENIVFDALSKSKALGVFPTPVDKILQYAELRVNSGVDLSQIPNNFFAKSGLLIRRLATKGVAKVRGVLDSREKLIYLDLTQSEQRKKFVKLHETGHELCTWQGRLHDFLDDDETLDPDIKEQFEAEANFFASASLFQLNLFNDQMDILPLELASAMQLAKIFGSSIHAALRRYVEQSSKRCALLVLNKEINIGYGFPQFTVRTYVQSNNFTNDFGVLGWGPDLSLEIPFIQDYYSNRKFLKSEITILTDDNSIECNYHFFCNGYNAFVFIFPSGEKIKTKTRIIISS
ncbi:ImmA/IrrE family metallo-endopeptidase [Mucilaginibacter sp. BJC16-A38]|uniref:ImmA/IrrE family metallo-endopeptidase n=1 Tax=Mucilaginibacter phenanthrenivorans TaxID=1234842 RepID=UPI0021587BD3|nr:ImmA/IrrE family metallo-endopeptidase [Mucilaginibacter phenanthrenivorans]MCR8560884.1 ImmA/IrrE family metallo-endopeptidase [Mucilaginibacter phenanthrenivorans]